MDASDRREKRTAKRARRDPRLLETALETAPRASARVDSARFDRVSIGRRVVFARVCFDATRRNCTVSISSP